MNRILIPRNTHTHDAQLGLIILTFPCTRTFARISVSLLPALLFAARDMCALARLPETLTDPDDGAVVCHNPQTLLLWNIVFSWLT
jgi:hypothetical protein